LRRLREDWPDHWGEIVAANNRPAPLWLRLNRKHSAPATIAGLEQAGFTVEHHPAVSGAIKISPAAAVSELPGFRQGMFSVQDPAAQLAAGLLDSKSSHRILDACAAPGGKTCHILEHAPGARLTALDRSAERLDLVRENLDRLGFSVSEDLRLLNEDASDSGSWWDGIHFDRILLDAPCTATGVIRRHPEIKWLRSPEQISEAANLQTILLDRLWPLLRPGGILLYATCSVLKLENCEQIRKFMDNNVNAELAGPDASGGLDPGPGLGRQILPGEQEMDGFFYAKLRKKS
jgi:16S rRNA (cytosine967-C5)-methyltransferase